MHEVTVDLYLTPLGGFELRATVPFASISIGDLEAGKTHTVTGLFPTVPQSRRVTAVVHGVQGKARFADTSYRLLTPVRIGKQMPLSSSFSTNDGEVENPFPYVELYNPTCTDICLDDYMLKYWHACGALPLPERSLSLDGFVLPARGTLTVWIRRPDSALTVEDFNHRYGVSLTEGKDLLVTEAKIYSASDKAHRLDLCYRGEVISRVTYGTYCQRESDIVTDQPLLYGDQAKMSARQITVMPDEGETVLPGSVARTQIPDIKTVEQMKAVAAPESGRFGIGRAFTRLTKAPLVPLQAAKLIAGAVSALKGFFSKE